MMQHFFFIVTPMEFMEIPPKEIPLLLSYHVAIFDQKRVDAQNKEIGQKKFQLLISYGDTIFDANDGRK